MMAINKTIQEQLDLPFVENRKAQMASGNVVEYDVVGPVRVHFANRTTILMHLYSPAMASLY